MLTLRLAWRSFVRHRRRSIITVAAAALSLAMMIFFVGIADDGHARMAELGIRMGAGYVQVQGDGYQATQTLDHVVPDPRPVMERARAVEGVELAVPRVRASALISTGESSAPVRVSGVDPQLELQVSEIPAPERRLAGGYLRKRDQLQFHNQPADIYVGKELAKTLELSVGDRVVLMLSPRGASRPTSVAFLVRGVFRTGINELDQGYVEVPICELQRALGLGRAVTQVSLHLASLEHTAPVTAALRQQLPDELEVVPWQVALKELYDAIVFDDAGMYLMMAIIFVIVAIGIFNTILMSVVERTREFGVMMALGTRGGQLFGVVLAEGVVLAVISAVFGVAVGLAIHATVAHYGIDVGAMAGDYQIAGIVFEGRFYSRLTAGVVAKWTLVVMGLTIGSTLYPALRATRLQPVEAIRHA